MNSIDIKVWDIPVNPLPAHAERLQIKKVNPADKERIISGADQYTSDELFRLAELASRHVRGGLYLALMRAAIQSQRNG